MAHLRALLVFCLCGCALGVLEPPSRSSPNSTASQIPPNEQEEIVEQLREVWTLCYSPPEVGLMHKRRPGGNDVTDSTTFCATLPAMNECLSQEEAKWRNTHSETMVKVFGIFRELWETTTNKLCANQGEKLTAIVQEYQRIKPDLNKGEHPFNLECVFYGSIALQTADKSDANTPSRVWFFHHLAQNFKDCLVRTLSKYKVFVALVLEQMNPALDEMKCLTPQNESIVLCKSLGSGWIDRAGLCPLKPEDLDKSIGDTLVLKSIDCLDLKNPSGPELSELQNLEQFKTFFEEYCQQHEQNSACLYENTLAADMCLEDSVFKMFKLVHFDFELMHSVACFAEGRRLATVFNGAYVMSNSTDGVLKCLGPALPWGTGKMDVYRYYEALPGIMHCLGKVSNEPVVIESFTEVGENMKCLDPTDESVVLCKNLHDNT